MTEFTRSIDIPIKMLTPVWTGDASRRANGLKMSGIIGGLRHNFEMLVRKHGGQTCNVTGDPDQRCNYEKNQNICPACSVFGCTGLQRSFRLGLDLKPVSFTAPLEDKTNPNRQHDGTKYNHPVAITKWLAMSSGYPGEMRITDEQALTFMNTIKPVWPQDINGEIKFSIVPLNNFLKEKEIRLIPLLHYLLGFMASYTGLGAKVNQGWGVFCLDKNENTESLHEKGTTELAKLIEVLNFAERGGNEGLPDARDVFAATWTLSKKNPGFKWPNKIIPRDKPYLCTGFAMAYRLRRYMKFYENDNASKKLFVLPTGLSWDTDWRNLGSALSGKWSRATWKETLPFIRALFGRDDLEDHTKTAGLTGVSHLYKKNGAWQVRLFGRLPPRYCYRAWDCNRDTSVWLDWNADIVRNGIIDRFEDLLTTQEMWEKGDVYTLKTGGDL